MAISLSNITGATVPGFTTPGYTVAADTPPAGVTGKQWLVNALTGTQVGVTAHSASSPFTVLYTRPAVVKVLGSLVNGQLSSFPRNNYTMITRKGVTVLSGQPIQTMIARTTYEVPAGADVADAPNVKGCISAHIGASAQTSSGQADSVLQASI